MATKRSKQTGDRKSGRRATTAKAVVSAVEAPSTHEEIAARAYALFLARGRQHGADWEDWFRAEEEVRRTSTGGDTG